jgi:hypothetical protein
MAKMRMRTQVAIPYTADLGELGSDRFITPAAGFAKCSMISNTGDGERQTILGQAELEEGKSRFLTLDSVFQPVLKRRL